MRRSVRWTTVAVLLCAACGGRPAGPTGFDDAGTPIGDAAHDGTTLPDGNHADNQPPPDGGRDGQRDAPPQLDAAGYAGILCGWGLCAVGEEMCCVSGSAPSQQCVTVNAPGPQCDFGARCDGPEDCGPGQQCCMPSGAIMQSYCVAGACPAGRALCHASSDCTRAGEICCFSIEFGWDHWTCSQGPQCPS
jgi:hypothetical protein